MGAGLHGRAFNRVKPQSEKGLLPYRKQPLFHLVAACSPARGSMEGPAIHMRMALFSKRAP